MNVRMQQHGLAPGVQYCQKTDVRPEVPRIGSNLGKGLSRRPKQHAVDGTRFCKAIGPRRSGRVKTT